MKRITEVRFAFAEWFWSYPQYFDWRDWLWGRCEFEGSEYLSFGPWSITLDIAEPEMA